MTLRGGRRVSVIMTFKIVWMCPPKFTDVGMASDCLLSSISSYGPVIASDISSRTHIFYKHPHYKTIETSAIIAFLLK